LAVAGLLLFQGVFKVKNGIGWMAGPLSAVGFPSFIGYAVYVAEIVAPIAADRKLSHVAGAVIAFDMLMAIVLVLRSRMFSVNAQGGGWAIGLEMFFLLGGIAIIMLLGSGRYSLPNDPTRSDSAPGLMERQTNGGQPGMAEVTCPLDA
jgi:putative oxidoreductase